MKWVWYGLTFAVGFTAGALVAREIAIGKIESPVNQLADKIFGSNTYASGETKTAFNSFLRNN